MIKTGDFYFKYSYLLLFVLSGATFSMPTLACENNSNSKYSESYYSAARNFVRFSMKLSVLKNLNVRAWWMSLLIRKLI